MGMSVRHIVAVALIDADADPVDAGTDGQPRTAKSRALGEHREVVGR